MSCRRNRRRLRTITRSSTRSIIYPACRHETDPLDCSANAGARELQAADALGRVSTNLPRARAPAVDERTALRSIERGFNSRQLLEFGARQQPAIDQREPTGI